MSKKLFCINIEASILVIANDKDEAMSIAEDKDAFRDVATEIQGNPSMYTSSVEIADHIPGDYNLDTLVYGKDDNGIILEAQEAIKFNNHVD